MTEFSPFSCPILMGHTEASGFCFQSERLLYGREPNAVEGGTGKAEAAKLQDAGISPKQWPRKMSGRKKAGLLNSEHRRGVSHGTWAAKAERERVRCTTDRYRLENGARFGWLCHAGMAVANVLGWRGSNRVTPTPWKSPMARGTTLWPRHRLGPGIRADSAAVTSVWPICFR
jgi:hypothetical protein